MWCVGHTPRGGSLSGSRTKNVLDSRGAGPWNLSKSINSVTFSPPPRFYRSIYPCTGSGSGEIDAIKAAYKREKHKKWYKKQQNVLAQGIMCGYTLTCFIWERLQASSRTESRTKTPPWKNRPPLGVRPYISCRLPVRQERPSPRFSGACA